MGFQSQLRTRAAGTMDSTRMVLTSNLLGLSTDVLQRLPKRSSMEDKIKEGLKIQLIQIPRGWISRSLSSSERWCFMIADLRTLPGS